MVKSETLSLENKWDDINSSFKSIRQCLDDSIYGHKKAKRQIERVIGQWITGKQNGYCFGFEGPPGVGKTSLARKGLANCLKDQDGSSRSFLLLHWVVQAMQVLYQDTIILMLVQRGEELLY